ncbi:MAG TPA: DUF58 domain-containing protein [Verrucomicrobiae bacterium]|nr:DUF58 domain-containing protein [Verrucomicrobiae bacterium]
MNSIYKLFFWGYRIIGGGWNWSRRRFTRAGLCVVVGCLAAGATGLDIENTVNYQTFALLTAFLAVAFVSSFFFRARFSATRLLPRAGTAGQPLHYRVRIKNLTAKSQTGLTLLEEIADTRPAFQDWLAFELAESRRVRPFSLKQQRRRGNPFLIADVKEGEIPSMPPQGEVDAPAVVFPRRRGVLRFAGVTIARPDPLELFRSFIKVSAPQTVVILPKRYHLPPIALPGALRYQEGGVALATNVGRSDEFVALREYRHGDPLRHIHWRSWAKAGKPITKEFADEFFVRHALVLDTFGDEPNSEVLEEAVSIAASFACTIMTQESLLDLLFVGNKSYCFTAGRGLAHADQMLEILASVKHCADQKFERLEHLVLNHIPLVSGCICLLQDWDDARKHFVKKLRAIGIPLMVLVVTPPLKDKLDPGPLRDQPGHFHVLELGRIEEGLGKLR